MIQAALAVRYAPGSATRMFLWFLAGVGSGLVALRWPWLALVYIAPLDFAWYGRAVLDVLRSVAAKAVSVWGWVMGIAATTSSPFTISDLTNGTAYTVTLRAVNRIGAGPVSAGESGTPVEATWAQRGVDLDGEAAGDYAGHSVAVSSDGAVPSRGGGQIALESAFV